jgi:hypothetical protein
LWAAFMSIVSFHHRTSMVATRFLRLRLAVESAAANPTGAAKLVAGLTALVATVAAGRPEHLRTIPGVMSVGFRPG